jgi:hypothetical protein
MEVGVVEVETVLAWHEALNAGDTDRMVALCSEEVEVGGPRGSGRGRELLREWFARAGLSLSAERVFHGRGCVVVEQRAVWPGTEPATVASVFSVGGGRIASVVRHDALAEALAAAGLGEGDLVSR